MPVSDTLYRNLCEGSSYMVRNPVRDSSLLGTASDGAVVFTSVAGESQTLTVTTNLCDGSSQLLVYDGNSSSAPLLGSLSRYSGDGPFNYTARSGFVMIRYITSGIDSCFEYFNVNVVDNGISNVAASSVTGVSATLDWTDASQQTMWTIRYGTNRNNLNNVVHARSHPYLLQGLDELTTYYYKVYRNDTVSVNLSVCPPKTFSTRCDYERSGCVNYTSLHDCRVTCSRGPYANPTAATGVDGSRHVVNTTRTFDPRATRPGDTLWNIPKGETASIRLGNWQQEGMSERITYRYHVDTRYYDLLILQYAVVLENPDHGISIQPRFDFQIEDEYGNVIDPDCNSATFIPRYTNTVWKDGRNGVKWQDWAIIGLDLTPHDGRTIFITMTTKDCVYNHGHYGYAYFSLKCANRRIESLHCGADVANTFHAPEGFSYEWFNADAPATILARTPDLFVDQIGTYGCTMTFQGQSAGARCQFTSTAVAGPRFPVALFDTVCTDTINCKFRFHMTNNSVIAEDEGHTRLTTFPCESYEWIVDDTAHFYTTDLTYDFTYGNHRLQLVAKLSGGLCSDTLTYNVYRYPVCRVYDTIYPSICSDSSVRFIDTTIATAGEYRKDVGLFTTVMYLDVRPIGPFDTVASVCDSMEWDYGMNYKSDTLVHHLRTTRDCDSIRTLYLTVRYSTDTVFFDTCVENQLPRAVGYTAFSDTVNDTLLHVVNAQECDSSIDYSLHVWWNIFDTFDTTLCRHFLPIQWGPFSFDHACTQSTNLREQGMHGEDSNVTLTLYVNPDYYDYFSDTLTDNQLPRTFRNRTYTQTVSNDSFYMQSVNGCDSVVFYSLWIDYHVVTCDKYLQFPNVVTPNGDGHNDSFVIVNLLENDCYEHTQLFIYNRWGHVVYQAHDLRRLEDFWDPAVQNMPDGTYYYTFRASGARGWFDRNGTIEVIR